MNVIEPVSSLRPILVSSYFYFYRFRAINLIVVSNFKIIFSNDKIALCTSNSEISASRGWKGNDGKGLQHHFRVTVKVKDFKDSRGTNERRRRYGWRKVSPKVIWKDSSFFIHDIVFPFSVISSSSTSSSLCFLNLTLLMMFWKLVIVS